MLLIAILVLSAATVTALAAVAGLRAEASTEDLFCTDDVHGANDEPGQKDLTRMCIDSQGDPITVQFNWDEIYGGGANTYDACNMFDTDGDGNINYSFCLTVTAHPTTDIMEYGGVTLYSCGDDKPDRCTQPVVEITPSFGTSCSASQQELDPVPAGAEYPQDTVGQCTIVLSDVGGENAVYANVCSFPSQQPNSDPSDCITEPGSGFLIIEKVASPDLSSVGFPFLINDGDSDLYNPTIYGSGVSDRYALLEGTYSVKELVPEDWTLESAVCVDGAGAPVGTPNLAEEGVFDIPLAASDEITCTFEDSQTFYPNLNTTPNPEEGYVDDLLQDSAQLSDGYNPGGTITLKLFAPGDSDCEGAPVHTEQVTVTGNGVYNTTTGHMADSAGTWRWVAQYSGDAYNAPASSGCDDEQVTISKYPTTTVTEPDPEQGIIGDVLNDTVRVTSEHAVTGQATFRLYPPGDTLCNTPVFTETVTLQAEDLEAISAEAAVGQTTSGYTSDMVGIWNWTAEYLGDYANLPSSDQCGDQPVEILKDTPSISTLPDPEQGHIPDMLHDTATITGGYSPTGTITFRLFEPGDTFCETPVHTETVPLSGGSASTVTGYAADRVGVWRWKADYSGDANNNPVSSGCNDELVSIDPTRLYLPIIRQDHLEPWCRISAKQIAPDSYTVQAWLDWEFAAPPDIAPDAHRIKWGDNTHTEFYGAEGEELFYHTYGDPGWYEVLVMLWGTDGLKYFPCGQWVDPPPQFLPYE